MIRRDDTARREHLHQLLMGLFAPPTDEEVRADIELHRDHVGAISAAEYADTVAAWHARGVEDVPARGADYAEWAWFHQRHYALMHPLPVRVVRPPARRRRLH